MSRKAVVFLVLSLIWMGVIFYFSAKPAYSSEAESDIFVKIFVSIGLDRFFDPDTLSFIVRKTAHAIEYTVLCLLLCPVFSDRKSPLFSAFSVALLYACTDEIHQFFVYGRACRIFDICVDAVGCLIAIGIFSRITRK